MTGDWRPINLERAPFHLPAPQLLLNEQCTEGGDTFADKSLALWRVEDSVTLSLVWCHRIFTLAARSCHARPPATLLSLTLRAVAPGRKADMDNDDVLVGRLLSRREAVKLLGIGGAAAFGGMTLTATGPAAPPIASSCVVRPEMTEGPFFVDAALARSDVRANCATGVKRDGVALGLAFNLSQIVSGRCAPLPGADRPHLAVRRAWRVLGRDRSARTRREHEG